jgi:NAD kinase
MKIQNVLLATKQTALEHYRQHHDNPSEVLPKELLDKKRLEHEEHYESFNYIRKILDKYGIKYQRVYMPYGSYEEFEGRDLIISIGGDGTVLNTAHYILDDTPLLTVKSEGDSVGALCMISANQFEDTFKKILNDDFNLEIWTRVEGKFGHKTDIALNEIAVGQKHFNAMAQYSLKLNNEQETQRSSKIIISTGAGSTGWYSNVQHNKGEFSKTLPELRFTVSEDIKKHNYKMVHGHIQLKETLEITSLMDTNGCISFDGDSNKRMYDFPIGHKLQIKISDKPLHVIVPI